MGDAQASTTLCVSGISSSRNESGGLTDDTETLALSVALPGILGRSCPD